MESIITGNLKEEQNKNPERRGWFIGHFIDSNSIFHNNNFEVRWSAHKKGETKKFPAVNLIAKTISILIKGKFILKFPRGEHEEIILSKLGDFIFWNAGVSHDFKALADCIILTIRWPSVPNDQKPIE